MLWKNLFVLLLLTMILIFFGGCQKSFRVLNHNEIQSSYRQGDVRYIPSLKEVVTRRNRDLGHNAMMQLGNFYRDLSLKKINNLTPKEKEVFDDLENFFLTTLKNNDLDFNFKNIIYHNLMFSHGPEVWDIYEEVLNSVIDDPGRENMAAVLGFIGKRGRWFGGNNFERSLSLCRMGVDSLDPIIFSTGLDCWQDMYKYVVDAEKKMQILDLLVKYQEKFQDSDDYRHYLILIHSTLFKGLSFGEF